jgi:heme o synthase
VSEQRARVAVASPTPASKAWSYVVLTKPDVTFLVVITTVAGFYLGSTGPLDWVLMLHTLFATMLVAGGTAALNQYIERDMDAVMRRTAARPLPSGTLATRDVVIFGVLTIIAGTLWLLLAVNAIAALVALATTVLYLCAYTPLKTRTPLATAVGAIPGALPPLIGWAAARGSLSIGGWVLFAILFFWQFPHFMAIAWIYRRDYQAAGCQMLSVVDPAGSRVGLQAVLGALVLLPVSVLPAVERLAGPAYFGGALLLGLGQLAAAIWFARRLDEQSARLLLRASLIYLPAILVLLLVLSPIVG